MLPVSANTSLGEGRAQAGVAPGMWLGMAAPLQGCWCYGGCPCVMGGGVNVLVLSRQLSAAMQQTGPGTLPALSIPLRVHGSCIPRTCAARRRVGGTW